MPTNLHLKNQQKTVLTKISNLLPMKLFIRLMKLMHLNVWNFFKMLSKYSNKRIIPTNCCKMNTLQKDQMMTIAFSIAQIYRSRHHSMNKILTSLALRIIRRFRTCLIFKAFKCKILIAKTMVKLIFQINLSKSTWTKAIIARHTSQFYSKVHNIKLKIVHRVIKRNQLCRRKARFLTTSKIVKTQNFCSC